MALSKGSSASSSSDEFARRSHDSSKQSSILSESTMAMINKQSMTQQTTSSDDKLTHKQLTLNSSLLKEDKENSVNSLNIEGDAAVLQLVLESDESCCDEVISKKHETSLAEGDALYDEIISHMLKL